MYISHLTILSPLICFNYILVLKETSLTKQFVPPTQPVGPGNQLPTSVPLPLLPTVEAAKRLAAFAAVDDHIDLDQKVHSSS